MERCAVVQGSTLIDGIHCTCKWVCAGTGQYVDR